MATKPVVGSVSTNSQINSAALNSALNTLAEGVAGCVSRAGTGSANNSFTGTLDMDDNRIMNIGAPITSGDAVNVAYLNGVLSADNAAGFVVIVEEYTATAGQTVFPLVAAYVPTYNNVMVFQQGARLLSTAYTETDANTITLAVGATVGDKLAFIFNQPVSTTDPTNIPASDTLITYSTDAQSAATTALTQAGIATSAASTATTQAGLASTARLAAEAAAATIPTFSSLTGQAGNIARVKVGETEIEYRTPAQVLSDIGAEPADADLAAIASASFAQGDLLYHNGTTLVRLPTGTSGQYLKTQGAAANPIWAATTTSDADNTAFEAFLNQIGLGRATGVVPNGGMNLFLTDDLVTKTNATYDATGDYYHNPAGYTADQCTGGSPLESAHQGAYVAANAFDNNGSTYWGSADPVSVGSGHIGYDFGAGVTKHVRRMTLNQVSGNYITSVKAEYSDDGSSWTTVSTHTVGSGGNTIDLAATAAHRYWRLLANGTFNGGGGYGIGGGWGVYEIEMMELSTSGDMVLVPAAFTAASAPTIARLYFLHKAVDASTLNTDITIEATNNDGTDYVAGTIALVCAYDVDYNMMLATVDFATSSTAVKWRVKTFNGKSQRIRAVRLNWS